LTNFGPAWPSPRSRGPDRLAPVGSGAKVRSRQERSTRARATSSRRSIPSRSLSWQRAGPGSGSTRPAKTQIKVQIFDRGCGSSYLPDGWQVSPRLSKALPLFPFYAEISRYAMFPALEALRIAAAYRAHRRIGEDPRILIGFAGLCWIFRVCRVVHLVRSRAHVMTCRSLLITAATRSLVTGPAVPPVTGPAVHLVTRSAGVLVLDPPVPSYWIRRPLVASRPVTPCS
jgi:hypothetical protein